MVDTLCPVSAERSLTELSSPTTTTRGVFLELQCITGLILFTATRVWVQSLLSDFLTDWLNSKIKIRKLKVKHFVNQSQSISHRQ